ncbi:MAG: HD-GYP domain-containing protein [Firmicutes bacterium]|nr:HD-GYP domain-containing protein [Bacillota bacterium]
MSFFNWIKSKGVHALYHDAIDCMVAALDARDPYSCLHSRRVADMSEELARGIGIRGMELERIHIAAHLHDIGKIGVPDDILRKTGKLSASEMESMRMHPVIGFDILIKLRHLGDIAEIVLHHHERWDGKGYPHGLSGEEIPLGSRIIAVADSIDAMTSHRPYRRALSWEDCVEELTVNQGIMYEPKVVEAALKLWYGGRKAAV